MSSRKVELRRKKVASLIAMAATEEEIAEKLNVDQSTISRDIKHLKVVSQKFVYDLAKSDLAFYYKQSIDGIQEVNKKAWEMYRNQNNTDIKIKAIFSLFSQGPSIMNIRALEERVNKIESLSGSGNRQVTK